MIPFHRCFATLSMLGKFEDYPCDFVEFWPAGERSSAVECDGHQATVRGPSMLALRVGTYHPDQAVWHTSSDVELCVRVSMLDIETPVIINIPLFRGDAGPVPMAGDLTRLRTYSAMYALRPVRG